MHDLGFGFPQRSRVWFAQRASLPRELLGLAVVLGGLSLARLAY